MVLCIMFPTGKEDLLPNLCGMFREECGPPVFLLRGELRQGNLCVP